METYHKLKNFISNNIIINFTLKEVSTPLSILRVPELKRLVVKPLTMVSRRLIARAISLPDKAYRTGDKPHLR